MYRFKAFFLKVSLKTSLAFVSIGFIASTSTSAPYCDGSFDDHLDHRCPPRLVFLQTSPAANAALADSVSSLSKRISETAPSNSNSDSNYLAFVNAAKACYDTNDAGEFTADLAGFKKCAFIRNSHLSMSLTIYATMTKTNIKNLARTVEMNPDSLGDLIVFLRSQTEENLDRTNHVWKAIFKKTLIP